MDDLLSGAETEQEAKELIRQMNLLLSTCNMRLRKWLSNVPEVLTDLEKEDTASYYAIDDDLTVKTLGLIYHPSEDVLKVKVKLDKTRQITMRTIQSDIARIFDPLGLLGPIILKLKCLMQLLWLLRLDWDEAIPQAIQIEYLEIRNQIEVLENIYFKRQIRGILNSNGYQLIGFCDASEKGYGACVYLQTMDTVGNYATRLICAKSKVAPIKRLTLARLELCGAELLSSLLRRVSKALNLKTDRVICFSDSTIVLHWLSQESRLFYVFVANRISRIQANKLIDEWRHVPSKQNPADMLSRGLEPKEFANPLTFKFWEQGPEFLQNSVETWPVNLVENTDTAKCPEVRLKQIAKNIDGISAASLESTPDLVTMISPKFHHSHASMLRIFSMVGKFINKSSSKPMFDGNEYEQTTKLIVRIVQQGTFQRERRLITDKLPQKGPMRFLSPFIDRENNIRVGGRLSNSNLPYLVKHPYVLPPNHVFSKAIFRSTHFKNHHCGPTALLATVRQQFWPLNGKKQASKTVHNCTLCFCNVPKNKAQLMGHLPQPSTLVGERPFLNVCVDYAAGLTIHYRGRGHRTTKAYVCVIVCMATHAVHLELVGELTTAAFIAALKRFIGRRGVCRKIHCDNGTNFVGAEKEFVRMYERIKSEVGSIRDQLPAPIEFEFSPPYAPHFNGLAEAGVKSMKTHLFRVTEGASLTYEEWNTLLIQIEAVLNSRPLCALSEDPNDMEVLTPGHFIIGAPMTSIPEPCSDKAASNIERYHRLRTLLAHFWKRWSVEYITTKQSRYRWNQHQSNLKIGQLVLIHQENTAPYYWPLGRVTAVKPGADQIVRVVTVRTRQGNIDRAVTRVFPLPDSSQPGGADNDCVLETKSLQGGRDV